MLKVPTLTQQTESYHNLEKFKSTKTAKNQTIRLSIVPVPRNFSLEMLIASARAALHFAKRLIIRLPPKIPNPIRRRQRRKFQGDKPEI